MVSLTFYGGVNEVGGNKILLQDGDTKIFLDFGMSFGQAGKFFSEFLQPRIYRVRTFAGFERIVPT
jgi:ribonuclease J